MSSARPWGDTLKAGKLRQGSDSLMAVQRGGSTPEGWQRSERMVMDLMLDPARSRSKLPPSHAPRGTRCCESSFHLFFQEGSNVAGTFPAAGRGCLPHGGRIMPRSRTGPVRAARRLRVLSISRLPRCRPVAGLRAGGTSSAPGTRRWGKLQGRRATKKGSRVNTPQPRKKIQNTLPCLPSAS